MKNLVILAILFSILTVEAIAVEQVKPISLRYNLSGCADQGGLVEAQLAGGKFVTWRAKLTGSIRSSNIEIAYISGSYHMVVAHSYNDGSRFSYSTPIELTGSNMSPAGMLQTDFGAVLKDDIPGIEDIYRISLKRAASGDTKGSIECH